MPSLLVSYHTHLPHFIFFLLAIFPIVWLVGGIGVGVFGFKHSNTLGKYCYSALLVLLLLFFADTFFGISRGIQNRNRKDVYAQIYQGAPEGHIHISLRSWEEVASFNNAVKEFAVSNNISECRNINYMGYSGPPRCTFKGEHVAIWVSAGSTGIGKFDANLRIAPFDQKYPPEDFRSLFNSLTNSLQVTFTGRIEASFKEAVKN